MTVCIVEQEKALGGAWSVDRCSISRREIYHENACHLIEWYAGGYKLLENLSSVSFIPLSPQPVKVWKSGRITPYTSRTGILAEYILSWRAIAYGLVKLLLAYAGVAKYPRDSARFHLRQAVARVAMETRYRLPGIISFDAVRAPKGGFADFILHVSEELGRQDVTVSRNRAREIGRNGNDFRVDMMDGGSLSGSAVVVGESSIIQYLDGRQQRDSKFTRYHHVLVSLPASDTLIRNSYIHFPDHALFHRITYIEDTMDDDRGLVSLFLLQLRVSISEVADLSEEFNKVCNLYRIAISTKNMTIRKSIEANHVQSSFDSGWTATRESELVILRTIGDLSRNVILMCDKMRWQGLLQRSES